jgi:hypothetical protein
MMALSLGPSLGLALGLTLAGCDRGPSQQQIAAATAACVEQVDGWLAKQGGLGATYEATPHYERKGARCYAYVRGGDSPANHFESVVDVEHDRVVAGCSETRAAMGDTPCQVNGEPASGSAGRMTIERLTGGRGR